MSLFQFGFERRKCPSALAGSSVRRERPVTEEEKEEFEEEFRRRTEIRRQQQRHRKFQRASKNSCRLGVTETIITLW